MNIIIEPGLIERVVFQATRGDPQLAREYHHQFSACYANPPGDQRDRAFHTLHDRWFDRLGFRASLSGILHGFPHVSAEVQRLVIADAHTRRRQSVELFGKPGSYAVVASITVELLLDRRTFDYWARSELQHIEDMLDPDFGYDRSIRPVGSTSAAENGVRERYALLWTIVIDARLSGRRTAPTALRARRRDELARAFSVVDAATAEALLTSLWDQARVARPGHRTMLDWARTGLPGAARPVESAHRTAGAACPLCRFPTFDWAGDEEMSDAVRIAVNCDFPVWQPADGICGRCAELYRSRSGSHAAVLVTG